MKITLNFWKTIAIGLISIALFILFPLLNDIKIEEVIAFLENSQFKLTLKISLFNALISSFILVVLAFIISLFLLSIPTFSKVGKNLGLLIVPVTLGNISIAFITKLIIGDTELFSNLAQGSPFLKLLFLLVLQIYQFGLLFVYLFWMQMQNIREEKLNYAIANHFSFYQKLKDIYLPHTRNLWILLASMGFVFSFYEESKISYLFKVSRGTNSELITNWLNRTYQTNLLVNPEYARNLIFNASSIIFLIAVLGLVVLFSLFYFLIKKFTGFKIYPEISYLKNLKHRSNISLLLGYFISILGISPILLTPLLTKFSFNFSHLGFPLVMTFFATLASALSAILFGISSRLGWKVLLSSFTQKSLPFFVLLFALLLLPPIVILITGYKWMSFLGYNSEVTIYIIWIIGHILLTLPILGSFVLFNHFRVTNNEIDYLEVYKLSKTETINNSFIKRFRAEYVLLLIIAYSFIWNEAVLNNIFSDYIPSFVSGMKMLITGRGADYEKAFGYLIVSIGISTLSAIVWRYILIKGENQLNKQS